jgi:hypothetical protein
MSGLTKEQEASCARANARAEAEDRAVSFLCDDKWSPQVAAAIAIRVEFFLAATWEAEQEQRRWDDPREVVAIERHEMQEVRNAFARTRPGMSDVVAERHVVDLLTKFPPDRAWWIARKVREYMVGRAKFAPKSQASA